MNRWQSQELAEYDYIWCRTFGHDWEAWQTDHRPQFGYYESVYCPRCTTERLFNISLAGEVLARRYIYPEGYKLAWKITVKDLRRQMRKDGWFNGEARKTAAKVSAKSGRRLVAV